MSIVLFEKCIPFSFADARLSSTLSVCSFDALSFFRAFEKAFESFARWDRSSSVTRTASSSSLSCDGCCRRDSIPFMALRAPFMASAQAFKWREFVSWDDDSFLERGEFPRSSLDFGMGVTGDDLLFRPFFSMKSNSPKESGKNKHSIFVYFNGFGKLVCNLKWAEREI